jgi:hypothetical protein
MTAAIEKSTRLIVKKQFQTHDKVGLILQMDTNTL